MDMYERIKSGEFDCNFDLPPKPKRRSGAALEKWRELRDEWIAESHNALMRFKDAALEDVGLAGHPKAEKAWLKAWDTGHAYGHSEVYAELVELADILL